jgi:uncharacterized protein (DUF934 family)
MTERNTMKLIPANAYTPGFDGLKTLVLDNTADPLSADFAADLSGVQVVELQFPKGADGRAFSQAYLLRRRLGFKGTIRATGDFIIDQVLHMSRTGFDEAVLREDQDLATAQRILSQFAQFYQGDAVNTAPLFVKPFAKAA